MKLLRYGAVGAEKAGALDAQGNIRDLSQLIPGDLTPDWLSPERLKALQSINLETLPIVDKNVRLGVPVAGIRQFMAIGLNYKAHAAEAGRDIPKEPVIFSKAITSLSGPNDDILLPKDSVQTDWEIELGFIIGTKAQNVSEKDALKHIAGYCLANDVSERDWQINRSGQWSKGKSFDTFGPIGPWLVTTDELTDPQKLEMELKVNGEVRQHSNTADMIFPVATLLSHLSQFMTLLPGDVVITGTPSGVGLGMKPQQFLKKGDVVTLRIDQLGTQTQKVV